MQSNPVGDGSLMDSDSCEDETVRDKSLDATADHWAHLPMDTMGDLASAIDVSRITEVKAWLASLFEAAGRDVATFEYTPCSMAHLHSLATLSQSRSRAASIDAADLRLKASEYHVEATRICEIPSHFA
ncbi:hypothetical protein Cni_G04918 [Canna indica]|uniref:Uncharacterized protein n=1 Tax=Canna indica TaxID=4628 RepID=A0AAQ3JUC0_9LILI|nr:hypothetical protein Cni_G04918 [Canna indica]